MRILKNVLVGAAVTFSLTTVAMAKEAWVSFDVHSSGPTLYPCNAGIKHPYPTISQICHIMGTTTSCAPGQNNCVCTSVNGGAYRLDYMKYQVASWSDNQQNWGTPSPITVLGAGQNQYSKVVQEENSLNYMVKNVEFNLGSEQYGACYYLDMCYRGPQIDYWSNDPYQIVPANFAAFGQVSISALDPNTHLPIPGQSTYLNLARAKGRVVMHCDLQGKGTQTTAANSSGVYDTTVNDIDWNAFKAGSAGSSDWVYGAGSSFSPMAISTQTMLPQTWITLGTGYTPRFCTLRYEFCESEGAERRWARQDARFTTFTRIEEPEAQTGGQ